VMFCDAITISDWFVYCQRGNIPSKRAKGEGDRKVEGLEFRETESGEALQTSQEASDPKEPTCRFSKKPLGGSRAEPKRSFVGRT
jgi:hypothetical protein